MAESFTNKVCVVTGAGSGIGRELVARLLEGKAKVYALDVNEGRLETLQSELGMGGTLEVITVDVSNRAQMVAAAERIHRDEGKVDLLINNAGITLLGETENISFKQWRDVLDTNYLGTLHGIHCFYPQMVERGAGHITNVASIAGSSGYASAQVYATSKAAVIGFTRSLEVEAKMHGVKITIACPSYVDTAIFNDSLEEGWSGETIRSTFMTKPISAKAAAGHILKGIRRGKKMVVFPFTGRLLYWMSQWCPCGLGLVQKVMLEKYRSARPTPD